MYKEMKIWSGGSKNAKNTKWIALAYSAAFILVCMIACSAVVINTKKENSLLAYIFFAFIVFLPLVGMMAIMLYYVVYAFKSIRENKQITLYLYDLETFAGLGKIPDDKFVLFSDENGVVLGNKEHMKESKDFRMWMGSFYDFQKYYEKQKNLVHL